MRLEALSVDTDFLKFILHATYFAFILCKTYFCSTVENKGPFLYFLRRMIVLSHLKRLAGLFCLARLVSRIRCDECSILYPNVHWRTCLEATGFDQISRTLTPRRCYLYSWLHLGWYQIFFIGAIHSELSIAASFNWCPRTG